MRLLKAGISKKNDQKNHRFSGSDCGDGRLLEHGRLLQFLSPKYWDNKNMSILLHVVSKLLD